MKAVFLQFVRPQFNLTLVLQSCTKNNSVTNLFRCVCYTRAVIPLSYAAQIPTTRDPDIANVRLSVSRVGHQVGTTVWCACFRECVRICVCMYEELCMYVCGRKCVFVRLFCLNALGCVYVVGWRIVLARMILLQWHIQYALHCTGQGFYQDNSYRGGNTRAWAWRCFAAIQGCSRWAYSI